MVWDKAARALRCIFLGTPGLLEKMLVRFFYVWFFVHHKLIYIKNQRDATWQYVY
jgi:hypothetical protein